jgi:hypothetical protein
MQPERATPDVVDPRDVPVGDVYITLEEVRIVLERQSHRCAGCGAPLRPGLTYFDLRRPVICGGSRTPGNVEGLCPSCHRKHMRRIRELMAEHRR